MAAFGWLSETLGTEALIAVVETHETGADSLKRLRDAIVDQVKRALGLGIRQLFLVPPGGVEKTTSGKIARAATRERYESEIDA